MQSHYHETMSEWQALYFFDRVRHTLKAWEKLSKIYGISKQNRIKREKDFLLTKTNFNPWRWSEFLRFRYHQKRLLYPGKKW